jgi:hypothetical protein
MLTSSRIELPAMPRAGHDAFETCAFGEWTTRVRTDAVQGDNLSFDAKQADNFSFEDHFQTVIFGNFIDQCGSYSMTHSCHFLRD